MTNLPIPSLTSIGLSILLAFLGSKLFKLYEIVNSTKGYKSEWVLIGPKSVFNFLLPEIPYINLGRMKVTRAKYDFYGKGVDIVSYISFLPKLENTMFIADSLAIREGTSASARFGKPMEFYRHLNTFGDNILASEGEQWKKYKKITSPSFNERNNRLVWDETIRVLKEMFEVKWNEKTQTVVTVDNAIDMTYPLTLMIMISAGFGTPTSWKDVAVPEGHEMNFQHAVHVLVKNLILRVALPPWILSLRKKWRPVNVAGREVNKYLREMIRERQRQDTTDKHDLLSGLIRASAEEKEGDGLSEQEIMGNVFIYLVAGHDTSANTLNVVFAFLALYPEEQQKLFEKIRTVIPEGRYPTHADMSSLTYTTAVIYETLRLFSVIPGIPRTSVDDTSFSVLGPDGKTTVKVPILKDNGIIFNWPALHYNPSYWEDPEEFKPARFLGNWSRDAFMPFSLGPRACPGRRFAETEMNAIVTTIISKYRVEITEDPKFVGESFVQKKERILSYDMGVTLEPYLIPLTFHRRT